MNEALKEILAGKVSRDLLLTHIDKHPEYFSAALELALDNDPILSWRATWMINQSMVNNDERIEPHLKKIIEAVKTKRDGHQRELLKILTRMNIDEDIEGCLFDICMLIWEDVDKIPSVRITAFRIIVDIAKKYPELVNEIEFLTQKHYAETLSPGIMGSFYRMKKELAKTNN
ncbi:MAG: hypothetical protein JXL97_04400 [Bacteroidales bacterium]|nr:hypothetical protein [Bacteroidales bacterium]